MKASVLAVVVAIVLAVGTTFALDWPDRSTANVEQTHQANVRL
jgi:hypothetical protein